MDDDEPPPTQTDHDLAERIARLEGVVETEDKLLERGLESTKNAQGLILGVVALVVAAAVAILVYVLQRLDTMEMTTRH